MKRKSILTIIPAIWLTGCAQDPQAISPAYVSTMKYDGASCEQIVHELVEIEPRLAANVQAQDSRRAADAMGIILIGISPTMVSPDGAREYEIARLKGEVEALRTAGGAKGCSLPPPPPVPKYSAPDAAAKTTGR